MNTSEGILTVDDLAARLFSFFEGRSDIVAAYIFGSIADGTATVSSDVDVAVLAPRNRDKLYYGTLQIELIGRLTLLLGRDDVDVVVLNSTESSELKYNIIQDGRVIFERIPDLVEYELQVKREYYDHMDALRRAGLTKG